MHEVWVARHLVELACEHAASEGATRVRRVRVRLGVLSGLVKPLSFCFAAACRGTPAEGAILDIDEVPLRVFCPACREAKSPPSLYSFRCPTCGTPTPQVLTGREMQLVSLELEGEHAPRRPRAGKERASMPTAPRV